MASGNDVRLAASKEVTFGTRVVPANFFAFNGESFAYNYNKVPSRALGNGRWYQRAIPTSSRGEGALQGEVPTAGFGWWLDLLHGNAVTPVQQAATTAYLQTHTLDTPPSKSASVQVQVPPVKTSTLVTHDLVGLMLTGVSFSWEPEGLFMFSMPGVVRELMTGEAAVSYVAPPVWEPLSFRGGSLTIGGSLVDDIIGGGTVDIGFNLRTDGHALGTDGLISKPVETDKPSASGSFTADFNDNVHLQRTIDNTIADVVLKFEGATIEATHKYYLQVTIPDCEFRTPRATVEGPGPVQQNVTFNNASTTNDPVVIEYMSTAATTALY